MRRRRKKKVSSKSSSPDGTVARLRARLDRKEDELRALRAENRKLRSENSRLKRRVRDLEGKLGQNSSNSSRPPSSDPPWSRPKRPRSPRSGRQRGAQPGHRGTHRKPFPPEQVDRRIPLCPETCQGCGQALPSRASPDDPPPRRHQVVDLPPSLAEVIEWVLHGRVCRDPHCGVVTWAELPPDAPRGAVGPRLQAAIAVLVGQFHISRRDVSEALVSLFGPKAELAVGTVSHLEEQTSDALKAPYEEAIEAVRKSPVAHSDETGFRQENRKAWLWIAVAGLLAVFAVHRRRSRAAFEKLLGGFAGILVSDRWRVYMHWPRRRWQICWAHLRRDFQGMVDRKGPGRKVGSDALEVVAKIFTLWRRYRRGQITHAQLRGRLAAPKKSFKGIVRRGLTCREQKARAVFRELDRFWDALWTFARYEGVEPTNNSGERSLRRAVLWRKRSFGCQSERGARFVERILTVTQSLRLQDRPVLDFIEQAIRAHQTGDASPSLIPNRVPRRMSRLGARRARRRA